MSLYNAKSKTIVRGLHTPAVASQRKSCFVVLDAMLASLWSDRPGPLEALRSCTSLTRRADLFSFNRVRGGESQTHAA